MRGSVQAGDGQRALGGTRWRTAAGGAPGGFRGLLPRTPRSRIVVGRSHVFPCRFGFCPAHRFATTVAPAVGAFASGAVVRSPVFLRAASTCLGQDASRIRRRARTRRDADAGSAKGRMDRLGLREAPEVEPQPPASVTIGSRLTFWMGSIPSSDRSRRYSSEAVRASTSALDHEGRSSRPEQLRQPGRTRRQSRGEAGQRREAVRDVAVRQAAVVGRGHRQVGDADRSGTYGLCGSRVNGSQRAASRVAKGP